VFVQRLNIRILPFIFAKLQLKKYKYPVNAITYDHAGQKLRQKTPTLCFPT
jgi:hypothetical protein